MKRFFSFNRGLFVVLVFAAFASCAGGGQSAAARKVIPGAPDFVLHPPKDENVIYGVGSAKLATVNMSMSVSETRARMAIARELSSVARQMIDDYTSDASEISGNKREAETFAQIVSRNLSEARMAGAKVVRREPSPDGTWWCLVAYNKSAAAKDAIAEVDREKVNYAAFRNWNAQRDMDAAFARQKNEQMEHIGD
ncbi:MAG: LPP20 family lipoprotein [Spirochaetaceae bacterium]|jgi:hypothetical protein|nr:LPP20 family lipoprotein [Spirochaetaceae bacterium]